MQPIFPEDKKRISLRGQNWSRRQFFRHAIRLAEEGRLYDPGNGDQEDAFLGSVERFSWIAYELRGREKVLDIGPGNGILLSLLCELGHKCYAIDWTDAHVQLNPGIFVKDIEFKKCAVEIEPIPYPDNFFDGVTCCQVFEHFTHSHLHAIREMYRVLKPGGQAEVDVPNAVDFRNRSRVLRGKHITWDYETEYLYKKPTYFGSTFFYDRHNREFTKEELGVLLKAGGFEDVRLYFLKSSRYRKGLGKMLSIGSAVRDIVPSFRKSIIGFGVKTIRE